MPNKQQAIAYFSADANVDILWNQAARNAHEDPSKRILSSKTVRLFTESIEAYLTDNGLRFDDLRATFMSRGARLQMAVKHFDARQAQIASARLISQRGYSDVPLPKAVAINDSPPIARAPSVAYPRALEPIRPEVMAAQAVHNNYGATILTNAQRAAFPVVGRKIQMSLNEDQGVFQQYYHPAVQEFLQPHRMTLKDILKNDDARSIFYKSSTLTNTLFMELLTLPPDNAGAATDPEDHIIGHALKISRLFLEMAQAKEARFNVLTKGVSMQPGKYPELKADFMYVDFIRRYLEAQNVNIHELKSLFQRKHVNDRDLTPALDEIERQLLQGINAAPNTDRSEVGQLSRQATESLNSMSRVASSKVSTTHQAAPSDSLQGLMQSATRNHSMRSHSAPAQAQAAPVASIAPPRLASVPENAELNSGRLAMMQTIRPKKP